MMIKYPHFAFNNLYLTNGYREERFGEDVVYEYEREDELEQCIRRLVLRKPEPLRGWDLRFLRRGLELTQADFGKMVDRDAQTVARWEKSAEVVPRFVDLMIRARFAERFEPQITGAKLLSFIDGTGPALPDYISLSLSRDGWKFTLAHEEFENVVGNTVVYVTHINQRTRATVLTSETYSPKVVLKSAFGTDVEEESKAFVARGLGLTALTFFESEPKYLTYGNRLQ